MLLRKAVKEKKLRAYRVGRRIYRFAPSRSHSRYYGGRRGYVRPRITSDEIARQFPSAAVSFAPTFRSQDRGGVRDARLRAGAAFPVNRSAPSVVEGGSRRVGWA